jgi:hypothetical protein
MDYSSSSTCLQTINHYLWLLSKIAIYLFIAIQLVVCAFVEIKNYTTQAQDYVALTIDVSGRDIILIDVTILSGLLILLTISSFSPAEFIVNIINVIAPDLWHKTPVIGKIVSNRNNNQD